MASQVRPRPMPEKPRKSERNIALMHRKSLKHSQQEKLSRVAFKIRKAIKPVSDKRREINKVYERVVRAWQKLRTKIDGFQCQFVHADGRRCQRKAHRRPHHIKRRGRWLCDPRWFLAVCLSHHDWIESHAKQAEKRGYIVREYQRHDDPKNGLPE